MSGVTDGLTGGYAFTVSVGGSEPLAGYFMKSLDGFVRFPERMVISITKRKRMQRPLRKQVAQIVNTGDPRYHPHGKPIERPALEQPQVEQPKPQAVASANPQGIRGWFCVACKSKCTPTYAPKIVLCETCNQEHFTDDQSKVRWFDGYQ